LADVLWEVFDYWYNQLPDEDISNAESGNRTKNSEIKTKKDFHGFEDAVVTTFNLPVERLRRWLDGKHLSQRGNWAKLLAALKTQNVPEEKREALDKAYDAAKQAT
jgi:hypothetical protein